MGVGSRTIWTRQGTHCADGRPLPRGRRPRLPPSGPRCAPHPAHAHRRVLLLDGIDHHSVRHLGRRRVHRNRSVVRPHHRGAFGVKRLCRVLEVSRSGFYRWPKAAPARIGRARSDARLARRIREIHKGSDGTSGRQGAYAVLANSHGTTTGSEVSVSHDMTEGVIARFARWPCAAGSVPIGHIVGSALQCVRG